MFKNLFRVNMTEQFGQLYSPSTSSSSSCLDLTPSKIIENTVKVQKLDARHPVIGARLDRFKNNIKHSSLVRFADVFGRPKTGQV